MMGTVPEVLFAMHQRGKMFMVVLWSLVVAACAPSVPFTSHTPQPMPELTTRQLLDGCWLRSGQRYLCRHSGLLEVFTRQIPLEGVVKVDTVKNEARLVAMDSFGVKLFDIAVSGDHYQLNYLLPLLEEHRELPKLVASSVQHIFLAPYPQLSDQVQRSENRYTLLPADSEVRFEFVGMPVRLSSKIVHTGQEQWQVNYYHYHDFAAAAPGSNTPAADGGHDGLWAPGGIVLDDHSGYRLTLWIQEIRELQ